MKLGIITTPSYDGIKAVADLGLQAAEFCLNIGVDLDAVWREVPNIKQAMEETGVVVGSIGRWGPDRINDQGIIEEELAREENLIELCKELGCPVYVTGCNFVEGLSFYQNCTFAIAYMERLLAKGKTCGVKICTYNCHWNSFLDCDPAWTMVHGHLPELGIKFDPSHSLAGGRDYLAEMERWGDRFYHVHLKGSLYVNGKHIDDPPAGLDQTNWGAFMALLYQKGYDGVLSLEPHSPHVWKDELGAKGVAYTVDYFKKMVF